MGNNMCENYYYQKYINQIFFWRINWQNTMLQFFPFFIFFLCAVFNSKSWIRFFSHINLYQHWNQLKTVTDSSHPVFCSKLWLSLAQLKESIGTNMAKNIENLSNQGHIKRKLIYLEWFKNCGHTNIQTKSD